MTAPELKVLFLTSFSDSCFQTIRAMAQLADRCSLSLTIAHICRPRQSSPNKRRELDSFFAEADHYDHCRRLLIEAENPAQIASQMCATEGYDLIVAPGSDRLGLHRRISSSFRARLMQTCSSPLWTAGTCLENSSFKGSIKRVGCLVEFSSDGASHLPMAVSFARRFGTRLRILAVIPPVHEGTLARALTSSEPLMPEVAIQKLQLAFRGLEMPEMDVRIGDANRELPAMLRRAESDVLFLGPGQALQGSWRRRMASYIDRIPCPAICFDGASAKVSRWGFQDVRTEKSSLAVREHAIAS
jgi:nucleotide-binding universal stress UspA family protein